MFSAVVLIPMFTDSARCLPIAQVESTCNKPLYPINQDNAGMLSPYVTAAPLSLTSDPASVLRNACVIECQLI